MKKLSVESALKEIDKVTHIANPDDYPAFRGVYNSADWPYTDAPVWLLRSLQNIYGAGRITLWNHGQANDMYTHVGVSSAMRFKADEILKLLKESEKDLGDDNNVLWADVQIQKKYKEKIDEKLEQITASFKDGSDEKMVIINAINSVKKYDILGALKLYNTSWTGQLNPWQNLEFIQNGGASFNKSNEPSTGISQKSIKAQALKKLRAQAAEMDRSAEKEIKAIIADKEKRKKELGIDPESIKATADNTMATYAEHIQTAKRLLDTTDTKIAERFAYHYLFKNR